MWFEICGNLVHSIESATGGDAPDEREVYWTEAGGVEIFMEYIR